MLGNPAKQHCVGVGLIAHCFSCLSFAQSTQPHGIGFGRFPDCCNRAPSRGLERGFVLPTIGAAVVSVGLATVCEEQRRLAVGEFAAPM